MTVQASFSSCREKGSSRAVVQRLKTLWHMATPTASVGRAIKEKGTTAPTP